MLAIIIPTYNRPAMLAKALLFLESCGVDCPIHVADGSWPENVERNARAIARLKRHVQVTHHPYPSDVPMYKRIASVADQLDADYILLHADDDYLFFDAVRDCVSFLEANPTHVCCQGPMTSCFLSRPANERLVPYITNPYEATDALGRVKTMIYQYSPTFYAVHRRTVLVEAFGGDQFQATNPRLDEIMSALHTVALGRVGLIDRLYGLRLVHPDQDSQADTWMDLMVDENFSAQWTSKMEVVVACTARVDDLPVQDVRTALRRAFLYYLRQAIKGTTRPSAIVEASRRRHADLVMSAINAIDSDKYLPHVLEIL